MATHKKREERCLFRGFHKCLVAVGDWSQNKHTYQIIVSSHKTLRWVESQLSRLVLNLKSTHGRGFQVEFGEGGPFNYFLMRLIETFL
jgi:hypothetical protein